jgi:hypothetical protein
MKSISRSTRLAVVPAVFAALALSACQDEAPTAAPPSPASPTAQQTATSEPTGAAPAAPSSAAPSEPAASSSSAAPSGGGCQSTDMFKIKRGDASPKPRSTPQRVKKDYGDGEAEVTIGQPTIDTSAGTSFFPGDGQQVVIVPVSIKAVTGTYVISELHFGLTDPADEPCKRDVLNDVVPKDDEVPVETLKEGDTISGKIGFAVPAGADLSKYTVVYAEDYNSGKADIAWIAK